MDMPGNYLNPMGLGYFNELFMAMYLGNYEGNIDVHFKNIILNLFPTWVGEMHFDSRPLGHRRPKGEGGWVVVVYPSQTLKALCLPNSILLKIHYIIRLNLRNHSFYLPLKNYERSWFKAKIYLQRTSSTAGYSIGSAKAGCSTRHLNKLF